MEIFKNGRKAFVAIPRTMPKKDAIIEANKYLKESVESLEVTIGYAIGDDLTIRRRGGNVWVITRRES